MSKEARPLTSDNLQIVNVKIYLKGQTESINNSYELTSVETFTKVNKISRATITFFEGNVATGEFPIIESNDFIPGTPIQIDIGYGTAEENEIAFIGIVAQVDIKTHSGRKPTLIVKCVDEAFKMSLNNKFLIYENKKDADLFKDLIGQYDNLKVGEIKETSYEHPSIVQFGSNDWDFLLNRAKALGYIITTQNGKISIGHPSDEKTIKVTFGTDVIAHNLTLNAQSLYSGVTVNSWNATEQNLRSHDAEEIKLPKQGKSNVDAPTLSKEFTKVPQQLLTHADIDTPILTDWASSKLLQYNLSRINGEIVIPGTSVPQMDSVVEILRVGNYFTGNGYISGVNHTVKDGKWTTKLIIGLKQESIFSTSRSITENGLYEKVGGLKVGIVQQIHDDPAGNARVLVKLPGLEAEGEGIWARIVQIYATKGAGSVIYPEINDEVLLGFLNDDAQSPIILGSLYSQTNNPPFQLEEGNIYKAFVSASQLQLTFDDDKKAIALTTPENNQITITDEQKGIQLEDQNGNKIIMDDKGITIESSSDLLLKSKGKTTIEATGNCQIKSKGDVVTEGTNITTKAKVKVASQANIIENKGTAQVVIKGGLVQIN